MQRYLRLTSSEGVIITDVEKQVFLLNEIISSSLEFKSLLKNPTSSQQDQINVLSKISDHYGFNILLKNFLCFLVEKKRL